jgi:transcriptional regulator with XRE-family HTH domain
MTVTFRSPTRLEFERRRRGWSRYDLAYHAGLHQPEISNIESGQRSLSEENAIRIGRALDVRPETLMEPVTYPPDEVPPPPTTAEVTSRIRDARDAEQARIKLLRRRR